MRPRVAAAFLALQRTSPRCIQIRDRRDFLDHLQVPTSPPTSTAPLAAAATGIPGAGSELVAGAVASTSAAVTAASVGAARVVYFLWGCLLGGIVGSLTVAIFAAGAAYGRENVSRALRLANVVWSRVLFTFLSGLNLARKTLVKYRRWRFGKAWGVLRKELELTRQTAADGIEAIKVEASLYSGVVGKLGFPLAQYAVDNLSPRLGAYLAKQNLSDALGKVQNKNIRRLELVEFDFGTAPPTLISARTYDLKNESAMAVDVDLLWNSDLEATIKVTPKLMGINKRSSIVAIPITLKNCRFEGVVRVILTPLTDEPPGFGAALVSFPQAPSIELDFTVSSVEVTKKFPWLKADLLKELQKSIANEFLWPKRVIIPSGAVPKTPKPMLTRAELEKLSTTDPLLRAENGVDANELVQRYEMIREVDDEEDVADNMNIFVGDEEERMKQLNRMVADNVVGEKRGWPGFPTLDWFNKIKLPKPWWDENDTDFGFDLPWKKDKQEGDSFG